MDTQYFVVNPASAPNVQHPEPAASTRIDLEKLIPDLKKANSDLAAAYQASRECERVLRAENNRQAMEIQRLKQISDRALSDIDGLRKTVERQKGLRELKPSDLSAAIQAHGGKVTTYEFPVPAGADGAFRGMIPWRLIL